MLGRDNVLGIGGGGKNQGQERVRIERDGSEQLVNLVRGKRDFRPGHGGHDGRDALRILDVLRVLRGLKLRLPHGAPTAPTETGHAGQAPDHSPLLSHCSCLNGETPSSAHAHSGLTAIIVPQSRWTHELSISS